ncbi:hypothetical protein [Halorarius halobius]|uniref:hypothetical protein n=1 Tax=Halorarius halobius TaxID=2962671 RepID=UPI0020CE6F43|nr:hypothetical protein [Halorarius halobius]
MRPPVRAVAALLLALPAAFALAFLLSPDPTGYTPMLLGLAGTVPIGAYLYTRLD